MLSVRCLSCLSLCDIGVLWPNGWMHQDETWHGGRTQPWPHCVRWGPSSPTQRGTAPKLSANVCSGQMAGWIKMPLGMEVGLGPGDIVLDGDPSPTFQPMYCGQTAEWIKMPLDAEVGLSPGCIVLDGDPAPPKRGIAPSIFDPCLLWSNGRPS